MPLTKFKCSDGEKILISDCYDQCRLGKRCCYLGLLKKAGTVRQWAGVPSVTQLQKSVREVYLEITKNYAIAPINSLFMILGTAVHSLIEDDLARLEYKGLWTGLPDHYDKETGELMDFKVTSIYTKEDTFKKWYQQVNAYRVLLEENGYPVSTMSIQTINRDAKATKGQAYASQYHVPKIDNGEIIDYFCSKAAVLRDYLAHQDCPEMCSQEETWNGIKCKWFCNVAEICKEVG